MLKNATSLRKLSLWQFGGCSEGSRPVEGILPGTTRYTQQFASELVFLRATPRFPYSRPRASPYAADCLAAGSELAWSLYQSFLQEVAPSLRV